MEKNNTYVGLDVHKATIAVAMLLAGQEEAEQWEIKNEPRMVQRLIRKLKRKALGEVHCCYEAGPCGYALQRQLRAAKLDCQVVAPALIPTKAGDRIKTDRRDALKLAKYHRAGMLTEVAPPTEKEEAVRDLVRARDDTRENLTRARHRLGKFLLRHDRSFSGKNWSLAHGKWLKTLEWEQTEAKLTFEHYLAMVEWQKGALASLDHRIEEVAASDAYQEPVGRLRCFRGIDTLTAMVILSELHGFLRFNSPRQLMAYLGLVPSEHSSGASRQRGGITKTGNSHVRRILVEAAWHYRHPAKVGAVLRKRREGQSPLAIQLAEQAQQRLSSRFRRLVHREKPTNKVAVAVARELCGFIWATLVETEWACDGGVA